MGSVLATVVKSPLRTIVIAIYMSQSIMGRVTMRRGFIALLVVLALPAAGETVDFNRASRWLVTCIADMQSPSPFPIQDGSLSLIWDRRAAVAEMDWPNGVKKILRQLNGNVEHTANFWYGSDTPMIVPEGKIKPIDCCSTGMLSFRASGEYAMTVHDISYGGMKALSQEGTCNFLPQAD